MKSRIVEEALASIQAVDWQALPPPAQRAFFTGLSNVLSDMMKADITPEGKRRINADRARRRGENADKLDLALSALASMQYEAMNEAQLRQALGALQEGTIVVEMILQAHLRLSKVK